MNDGGLTLNNLFRISCVLSTLSAPKILSAIILPGDLLGCLVTSPCMSGDTALGAILVGSVGLISGGTYLGAILVGSVGCMSGGRGCTGVGGGASLPAETGGLRFGCCTGGNPGSLVSFGPVYPLGP